MLLGMQLRPVANPPNPWASTDLEYLDGTAPDARLVVLHDHSRTILSKNDSPDIGFTYSVNPYRGCFHGCAYCYARPSHEYLSMGAGTDFERKIVVKPDAPQLLRDAFDKRDWRGEVVVFSGVTDCYQPLEASYRLTRGCLEVCNEYRNPVSIITKSPLIERDGELLEELHRRTELVVCVSIPLWDADKARAMEPFVATPQRRMRTIERLARRGIRVNVNVAPIIPGLGDEEIGDVLKAAKNAGATGVGWVLLRLPGAVATVFEERLRAALPLRAEKVLRRIRETRGGKLYDPRFGTRGRGEGVYAQAIEALVRRTAAHVGLTVGDGFPKEASTTFTRPEKASAGRAARRQLPLF